MLESRSKTFAPPAETGPGDAVAGVLKDADRLWEAVCDTADGYVAVIDRAGIIRSAIGWKTGSRGIRS